MEVHSCPEVSHRGGAGSAIQCTTERLCWRGHCLAVYQFLENGVFNFAAGGTTAVLRQVVVQPVIFVEFFGGWLTLFFQCNSPTTRPRPFKVGLLNGDGIGKPAPYIEARSMFHISLHSAKSWEG